MWRSNPVRLVGGRACVDRRRRAIHAHSQSVCGLGTRVAMWSPAGCSSQPSPPPPGPRLLTDITCATADQPACHVIATAATYTERSPRRPHDRFDVYTIFISQYFIFVKSPFFIFLCPYIIVGLLCQPCQSDAHCE